MIYKCLVYDPSSVVFIVGAKQYNNGDEQIKHALKSDIIYSIHFNVFKKKRCMYNQVNLKLIQDNMRLLLTIFHYQ